jgi:hypothetical protein
VDGRLIQRLGVDAVGIDVFLPEQLEDLVELCEVDFAPGIIGAAAVVDVDDRVGAVIRAAVDDITDGEAQDEDRYGEQANDGPSGSVQHRG